MQKRIDINAYDLLQKQAEKVPAGSDGLVVLPYFSGERTPINDPLARGLILGLTLSHHSMKFGVLTGDRKAEIH